MFVPEKTIEDIDDAGYWGCRLVVQSDQGRAVSNVVNFVRENRQGESVPMFIPQGGSQSLACEAWVKRANEQVRVVALCLESKVKDTINVAHPIWPWLLEWASQVLNRYRVDEA